jgi:hypothetical protein
VLANHVAVGQTGLLAHIAEESDTLDVAAWSEDHHEAGAAIDRHHHEPLPVGNGESPTGVR